MEGFQKISDKFVDKFLTENGESVEDAKKRMADGQKEREEKAKQEMEERNKAQEELVKKSLTHALSVKSSHLQKQ